MVGAVDALCELMGEPALRNEEFNGKTSQLSCEDVLLSRPPQSLLQRVERLDLIMSAMEDKAPTEPSSSPPTSPQSRRHSSLPATPSGLERRRKPTLSVLEEVLEKGTLVERVSDLEERILMLQQAHGSKSNDSVAYPGTLHLNLSHRRVVPHREVYDHPFSQDPIDVEKHEVTRSHSLHLLKHDGHSEPSVDSESIDSHSAKPESPHVDEHCEVGVSGGKAAAEEDQYDSRVHRQSKKKMWRIRKWLSKRLNIPFPGSSQIQDKLTCSTGHCWGPQVHPKSCWNIKKKGNVNSNLYTQYGHMQIDEDFHDCRERV